VKQRLAASVVGSAAGTAVAVRHLRGESDEERLARVRRGAPDLSGTWRRDGLLIARKRDRSMLTIAFAAALVAFAAPWIVYFAIILVAAATGNIE
jgi:hypothetical protein